MKLTEKLVVFYSAEKDGFLESYKDKGSLVFTATFTDRLRDALYLPSNHTKNKKTILTRLRNVWLRSA